RTQPGCPTARSCLVGQLRKEGDGHNGSPHQPREGMRFGVGDKNKTDVGNEPTHGKNQGQQAENFFRYHGSPPKRRSRLRIALLLKGRLRSLWSRDSWGRLSICLPGLLSARISASTEPFVFAGDDPTGSLV